MMDHVDGTDVAVRRLRAIDVVGVVLFIFAIAWTLLAGSQGEPIRGAEVLAASGVVLLMARVAAGFIRIVPPTLVLIATAAIAVAAHGELLSSRPLSRPFGYANAKGAFFMIAAIAGLMVATGTSNLALRLVGVAAAAGAAVVPFASHVVASSLLLVVIPVAAMLAVLAGRDGARPAVIVCGALCVLALAGTALLGARSTSAPASGIELRIRRALTTDRLVLWHEAEHMMAQHPLRGVGPARFDEVSTLARQDPSNRLFWAHNDFLQEGAELGIPGFVLLVGLFVWGFIALWANPTGDVFVALAASAVAAVGIQACVDYVLHFPAVALAVAALVGAGIAPSREGRTT